MTMFVGMPRLAVSSGITPTGVFTRALTIDHTQVPSTLSDFPVLVNFTDATFKTEANGGHVKADKAFTFSSDSGGSSLLKWEVERYNASTGEIVAWVKIASVDSTADTVFYLRYGVGITTDQSDRANVWTNSFEEVYHYSTASQFMDSVHNANPYNLSTQQSTSGTGQIDGGGAFDGSQQDGDSGYTWPTGAITLSGWVKGTSFPNSYNTMAARMFGTYNEYCIVAVKSSGKIRWVLQATTQRDADGTGSHTLSTGTWYHLALTYDSSAGLIGYVDGSSDATVGANGNYAHANTQGSQVGNDGVGSFQFTGGLDEIRYSSVARSSAWISCEHANQKDSQTFLTLGGET